jgi:cytochrome c biogenesis protein CcdA
MGVLDLNTLTLALGAGLVAALNPCGFALLPVYLSLFVLDEQPPRRWAAIGRALRATAAMTTGFAGVFVVFGLAIAPVASSVQRYLPGFTVALGLLIVAAGLWVMVGRKLPTLGLGRLAGRPRARPVTASLASMTGFGASYAIASLGCTIAPFLAVVVTAFRAGSTGEGVVLFLAYAAGMGLVVGTAAVAVALTRTGVVRRLRRTGSMLTRAAGVLLVVAGGYVAWYGAWELRVLHTGAGTDPLVEAGGGLQRWLAQTTQAIGAGGFLALLCALVVVGLLRRRTRSDASAAPTPHDEASTTTKYSPNEEHR